MQLNELLRLAVQHKASDLHIKAGNYPVIRIDGKLHPLTQYKRLMPQDTAQMAESIMNQKQKESLVRDREVDLAYGISGVGRFRCNLFFQRDAMAMVARVIATQIHTITDLNLPAVIEKISLERRGLVLVTGTTGSGKSTTLASMIQFINQKRISHILTIEDPIEFLHKDDKSIINQREIGSDSQNFIRALRSALRQDPDVILVGEMRDLETIETALLAAETGHLVLSTLHTLDAPETINRIIGMFPPHQQQQIRIQLASVLKAIISQRLIPTADGKGRVPAIEILINTPFIQDCIINPEKSFQIKDSIAQGVTQYGMQTFDQSLFFHYQKGLITYDEAIKWASNPDEFKLKEIGIQSGKEVDLNDMERNMTDTQDNLVIDSRPTADPESDDLEIFDLE